MVTKSPLARVKDEFGGKDKLVDKIVGLLGSADEPKDEMRRRLLGAANSKLVRLHGIATKVKELGGKDQLADAAANELGRGKDKDYVTKLGTFSSGKLVDILQSARRRNSRKATSTKTAPQRDASATGTAAARPLATKAAPATKAKRAPAAAVEGSGTKKKAASAKR